ncbi:HD-GYP domain-containing protein [Undibacterium sp. Dicai25W]|uniref:HD-GYP domain-containing protein n=1 Tax=Undibacterium sp. Dicai25W TaxID=3413034 RepID=UPI003BF4062D
MSDDIQLIAIDKVRIGMFVKLDLSWFEHSFPMSSFKITNQQQINDLLALKLKHVRYIPSKSDMAQSAKELTSPPVPETAEAKEQQIKVYDSIIEAKHARYEKLMKQRAEIAMCEEKFVHAATVVKGINKLIFSRPKETLAEANKLVDSIAEIFLNANDTVMHLIQQAGNNEDVYFHTLNVSVLAMMLASEMKCNESQIKEIGIAALFHDIGKVNVPDKILTKTEPLTKPEQNFFELHPQYGIEVGRKAGLSPSTLEVIANHHELMDGSGYPQRLNGNALSLATRIITVANVYDNLCNPVDLRTALTPHEALSVMYAHKRGQFDPAVMATMVKSLGVYPPGTIVKLSNEVIGLVMNVNIGKPLRPCVLVYDSEIPKESAIILDLSDEAKDVNISGSIRPGLLPRTIFEYLNPRKHVNYYFESKNKPAAGGALPSKPQ